MLKKILLFICLALIGKESISQIQAVTSTGDEVMLYNDGTWKYTKKSETADKIDTNKVVFQKSKDASFLLKSNIAPVGIHLNPKKWSFKKAESDDDPEYSLQLKGKDAYAMILTERIEVPLESLRTVALDNAKEVSPDVKVVQQEYRKVNGLDVLFMQMSGTIKGIKFSYVGYYYSNAKGSVQLVAYTSQSLLNDYRADLEELLNGFVVVAQ